MCDHRNPERGPMFQIGTTGKDDDDGDDDKSLRQSRCHDYLSLAIRS
jgi:hypothetical protein